MAASERNGATARILIRRRGYRVLGLRRSIGGEDEQDRDWAWLPAHQRVGDRPRPRARALAGSSHDAQGRDHQPVRARRSEEHTSELQSPCNLVCRLLLEKKKKI